MPVHRRVTPSIKFAGTHLYTWVERGTVRVKCPAQEHNTMSPSRARTRTAWSGDERTTLKATAPPQRPRTGNTAENWFDKIFRSVIVYKWSRLAKSYFLGLFEQLKPDFSENLEELQRSCFGTDIDCGRLGHQLYHVHDAVKATLPEVRQVNVRLQKIYRFSKA